MTAPIFGACGAHTPIFQIFAADLVLVSGSVKVPSTDPESSLPTLVMIVMQAPNSDFWRNDSVQQGCKKNGSRYGTFSLVPQRGRNGALLGTFLLLGPGSWDLERSTARFFCSPQEGRDWSTPRHVFLVLGSSGSPGSRIPGRSAAGKQGKRTFFF